MIKKLSIINKFCFSNKHLGRSTIKGGRILNLSFDPAENIKQIQQKAFLSSKIINILCYENDKKISLRSLSDTIITQLREQQKYKKVSAKTRVQLQNLFNEGIVIDKQIFPQYRIERVSKTQIKDNQKFIFCPSHLVTGQLFKMLINHPSHNTLYTGRYGISKTVSITLFWKLANMIVEYNFKKIDIKDQSLLKLSSQILTGIPKILYHNVSLELTYFNQLRYSILRQCQSQYISFENPLFLAQFQNKQNQIILSHYYKARNIPVFFIADQINQVTTQVKFLKTKSNKLKQDELKQRLSNIYTIQHTIRKISARCTTSIFFSSVGIQRQYLDFLKLGSDNNHTPLLKRRLQYAERLYQQQSMYQLVDFFIFQLAQIFQIPFLQKDWYKYHPKDQQCFKIFQSIYQIDNELKNPNIQIQSNQCKNFIRILLFKYLRQIKGEYFSTFYWIRSSLFAMNKQQNINIFKKKLQSLNFKDVMTTILQIFKYTIGFCQSQLRQKFHKFKIKQQDQREQLNKRIAFLQLYFAAKIVDMTQNNAYRYKVDLNYLQKYINNIQEAQQNNDKIDEKYIFKYIFHYDSGNVYCLIPPRLMTKILSPDLKPTINFMLRHITPFIDFVFKKRFMKGGLIEVLLIQILCAGKIGAKFPFFNDHRKLNFPQIRDKKQYFISIPKNNDMNLISCNNQILTKKIQQFINKIKKQKKISNKIMRRINKIMNKRELKWQFMSIFKYSFEKIVSQSKKNDLTDTYILYAPMMNDKLIIQNQSTSIISNSQEQQNLKQKQQDENSKTIDFMLIQFHHQERFKNIVINAFEVTVSNTNMKSKLQKFIEQFCSFNDRNKTKISINGQQYFISLNFFVIGRSTQQKVFQKLPAHLNNQFPCMLNFTVDNQMSSYIKVNNIQDNNKSLLTIVGYIPLGKILLNDNYVDGQKPLGLDRDMNILTYIQSKLDNQLGNQNLQSHSKDTQQDDKNQECY